MYDEELPVEAEAKTGDDNVTVSLGEEIVTILPKGKWRISAIEALREGRYSDWAKGAMTPESYDTWEYLDPTQDDVEKMFTEWAELTGNGRDLSRAQRRASGRSQKK